MSRIRVAVAVDPQILQDVIVLMLEHGGVDEVTTGRPDAVPGGHFDVAIVSADLPAATTADTLVRLEEGRSGRAAVIDARGRRQVRLDDPRAILHLLDELYPAAGGPRPMPPGPSQVASDATGSAKANEAPPPGRSSTHRSPP